MLVPHRDYSMKGRVNDHMRWCAAVPPLGFRVKKNLSTAVPPLGFRVEKNLSTAVPSLGFRVKKNRSTAVPPLGFRVEKNRSTAVPPLGLRAHNRLTAAPCRTLLTLAWSLRSRALEPFRTCSTRQVGGGVYKSVCVKE